VEPAETLALWTAPPGPQELAALLERVQPRRVHLFAQDPGLDRPEGLMRRLAGLVKFAIAHYDGLLDEPALARMAAQTAQRPATVRWGLRWLAAQGQVTLEERPEGWRVAPGTGKGDPATAQEAGARLVELLRETSAYRAYVRSADPHALLAVST